MNKPLFKEFLCTLNSKHTVKAYESDIDKFFKYLKKEKVSVADVTLIHLEGYYSYIRRLYKGSSVPRKMYSVVAYLKFLLKHSVLKIDPTTHFKVKAASNVELTGGLSNEEVGMILQAAELEARDWNRVRDTALLNILFNTGIRNSELVGLCLVDFNLERKSLLVHGKGDKTRIIPLSDSVFEKLTQYVSLRARKTGTDARAAQLQRLFILDFRKPNGKLHSSSIQSIMNRYAKRAGINRILTPHMARVTMVSNALDNGVSTVRLMGYGGWSSVNMVARYDRRMMDFKNSPAFAIDFTKKGDKK